MSENDLKQKYYLKSRQGIILGVVKVNEEDNVLYWNKVVDLLNSLTEENEQLKKRNKFLEEFDGRSKTVANFREENEKLRRLFEEMKQPITINLTEEDEKELRKLLGLVDDE